MFPYLCLLHNLKMQSNKIILFDHTIKCEIKFTCLMDRIKIK